MAAPDVTPYVDLTLTDVDAQTVTDRAIADAVTKLPEWTPREGNTELVILEGMALEVEELTFAVNRVPGAVVEVLLRLYGLTRDPGAAATATVTLTLSDTAGHTIPAGTRLLLDQGEDADPVELATDVDLVVASGSSTGTVAVTAAEVGLAGDGTPTGTALELLDAVPYVDAAQLASPLAGGRELEDGAAFLDRGAARLQRLVSTLVLPEHFTASALEEAYVGRAFTVDRYDPTQAPPDGRNGHVTVVASTPSGGAIAAGDKTALETKLEAEALAAIDVHIADPTVTTVDVDVTVTGDGSVTAAQLATDVEAALDAYLDPAVWPFGGTVYLNEVIALVDRVAGVDRVVTVTLNGAAADLVLAGVGPLADLNAAASTVTVS